MNCILWCAVTYGWLGGDGDGWERGPYWIDGLLPLAYLLEDEELIAKVKPWWNGHCITSVRMVFRTDSFLRKSGAGTGDPEGTAGGLCHQNGHAQCCSSTTRRPGTSV